MSAEPPRQASPLPDRIGEYQVLGSLGAGGMGRVYKAVDGAGRLVAVKVVRPEYAAVPEFRERFQNEVRQAARVPRYLTAEVVGAQLDGDLLYMVTEFIQGPSLHAAVAKDGPLSAAALEQLGIATAEALAAIHGAGLVHRDFKPSNVLLSPSGPRVIDFGIARAFDTTVTMLTAPGQIVGTPGFIAPEVYDGRPAGPAADVFAWGAVLLFAATGRYAFGTGPWQAVAWRVKHREPDLSGLEGSLREIVADALAKQPTARPTLRALAERLAQAAAPRWASSPAWPSLRPDANPEVEPEVEAEAAPAKLPHPSTASSAQAQAPPSMPSMPSTPAPAGEDGLTTHGSVPGQARAMLPSGGGDGGPYAGERSPRPAAGWAVQRWPTRRRGVLLAGASGLVALLVAGVIAAVATFGGRQPPQSPRVPRDDPGIVIDDQVSRDHPARGAGVLTSTEPRDAYVVPGRRDQLLFLTEVDCDGIGRQLAPSWSLTGPSGQQVGSGALCQGSTSPIPVGAALPENGAYRLTIEADVPPGAVGYYGFRLTASVSLQVSAAEAVLDDGEAQPAPNPADAAPAAAIDRPGDIDIYQFEIQAGPNPEVVYLDTRRCGNGLAAEMELTGPAGPVALSASQFCDPSPDGVTTNRDTGGWITLPQAGSYTLVVRGMDDSTGPYDLWIRAPVVDTVTAAHGQTFAPGQPAGAGEIAGVGDIDWYRFAGRAGQEVTFALSGCDTAGGARGGDLGVHLRGPDQLHEDAVFTGDHIFARSARCQDGGSTRMSLRLPADGTYEFGVHGYIGDVVGTYHATFTQQ